MPSFTDTLRLIEERVIALERDLQGISKGGGVAADSGYGCCSKEGCCEKQGCCERTKLPDYYGEELTALAAKFGLPVQRLLERIENLDPKLLR